MDGFQKLRKLAAHRHLPKKLFTDISFKSANYLGIKGIIKFTVNIGKYDKLKIK